MSTVTPSGTSYALYQTPTFTVPAGTHTIELLGLDPEGGDNTALVDQVTILQADTINDGSFESAGTACQYLPSRARRFALAILRFSRREQQRQRPYFQQSQCA